MAAAEGGDVQAQFHLGCAYITGSFERGRDREPGLNWLQRAAEAGLADAQFWLGIGWNSRYYLGEDRAQALKWYRLAAAQGDPSHQLTLAHELQPVEEESTADVAEALTLYRAAASQGHAHAQELLGTILSQGRRAPRDMTAAASWLGKAAEQGQAGAHARLAWMYETGQGMPQDLVALRFGDDTNAPDRAERPKCDACGG